MTDHLVRHSFIASTEAHHPYIIISRRSRVEAAVNVVKIVEKRKGVKTVKTKKIFTPAYDKFELRVAFKGKVYVGTFNFKEHNISRTKATTGAVDETWTEAEFIGNVQQAIQ
jgi:hypothetical protein